MTPDTLSVRIARLLEQFGNAETTGLRITPVEIEAHSLISECHKRIEELQLSLDCELGVRAMTVARLEGQVEGMPTHTGNFLQRIDELRDIEQAHKTCAKHFRRLMACDKWIEELEREKMGQGHDRKK